MRSNYPGAAPLLWGEGRRMDRRRWGVGAGESVSKETENFLDGGRGWGTILPAQLRGARADLGFTALFPTPSTITALRMHCPETSC